MSWVSDVIILCDLAELYPDLASNDEPRAIAGINLWLKKGGWAPLVDLSGKLTTEKAFQACAFGGALNHLDVREFLKVVAAQPWQAKKGVMLLIKNEEEGAFTPYRLDDAGRVLKIM